MGHTRAERDQHFLGSRQKEAPGEFPLQAGHGFNAVAQWGIGQQQHKLFATVARQGVLRAHGLARHSGQVRQGCVAGGVAQFVVECLEVVDVQQGHAQGGVLPAHFGELPLQGFIEALAVEGTGQGVVAGLRTDAVQLAVQFGDLRLGGLGSFPHVAQFVTGDQAVVGHGSGGAHQVLQDGRNVGQAFGLLDQPRIFFHLALKGACGLRHLRQPLHEGGQHLAHLFLSGQRMAFGLGLLEDHIFQAALHIVQPAQGERRAAGCHDSINLPFEPLIVQTEFANVLDDQVQQFEQRLLDFGLVFRCK